MSTKIAEFKAEFFKALGNPLRIRILDELRDGEVGVSELTTRLGAEQANISQQLAILRAKNIVSGRKQGNSIYYRCSDATIFRLLDVAKEIFNNQLVGVKDLLDSM